MRLDLLSERCNLARFSRFNSLDLLSESLDRCFKSSNFPRFSYFVTLKLLLQRSISCLEPRNLGLFSLSSKPLDRYGNSTDNAPDRRDDPPQDLPYRHGHDGLPLGIEDKL
jgi:hypothetical protein